MPAFDPGEEISPETLALAAEVAAEAALLPTVAEIRDLADQAVRHGGAPGMSREDLHTLAEKAVLKGEEMTDLLRQVRDMLRTEVPPDRSQEAPGG